MKTIHLTLLAITLLTGCAGTTRLVTDTVTAGGGALLADKLSHGNPLITAAGGAAGLLVGEGLHSVNDQLNKKAYATGFDLGRSDAVKEQYWMMIDRQKTGGGNGGGDGHISLYEIPVPEQRVDGAILKPTTKILRIQE